MSGTASPPEALPPSSSALSAFARPFRRLFGQPRRASERRRDLELRGLNGEASPGVALASCPEALPKAALDRLALTPTAGSQDRAREARSASTDAARRNGGTPPKPNAYAAAGAQRNPPSYAAHRAAAPPVVSRNNPRSNSAEGVAASNNSSPYGGRWSGEGGKGKGMPRSSTFAGPTSLSAKLSPPQRRALQTTWKHMSHNGGIHIMERIFQKLINSRPKVKDVFYKAAFVQMFSRYGKTHTDSITTLHDHGRIMAKVVDDLVSDLANSAVVMRQVMEMGRRHAFLKKSGLRAEVWESFGEAALEIVAGQDCVKSSVDAVRAWTILVACLIDELRFGFEQECRDKDKSRAKKLKARKEAADTCPVAAGLDPCSSGAHPPEPASPRAPEPRPPPESRRSVEVRPERVETRPRPPSTPKEAVAPQPRHTQDTRTTAPPPRQSVAPPLRQPAERAPVERPIRQSSVTVQSHASSASSSSAHLKRLNPGVRSMDARISRQQSIFES